MVKIPQKRFSFCLDLSKEHCNSYTRRGSNLPREGSEHARTTPAQPNSRAARRAYWIGLATHIMPVIRREAAYLFPQVTAAIFVSATVLCSLSSLAFLLCPHRPFFRDTATRLVQVEAPTYVCASDRENQPALRVLRATKRASDEPAAS